MKAKCYWILALGCCCAMSAYPQARVGRIEGRVRDSSGAALSAATLRVLNTGREAFAGAGGDFALEGVPAGPQLLEASAEGYATVLLDLRVEPGRTTTLDIRLSRPWLSLGEVTVNAERREAREGATAAAVTGFSGRDIRSYRLWDLKDISALVPGLYSADPGDGRNVTTVRGIGTTSYDPAVVTYIDGVCQFSLDTYIPQLIDAERIEVLRGPQGTLFGRNAMGGVIQVTTRRPGNRTRVGVESNVGNYGLRRNTATLRTPIVKDRLFLGIALQEERRDGFHRNLFTGGGFDGYARRTAGLDLRYASSGAWSARMNLKGYRTDNRGAFPLAGSAEAALENPYVLDQDATATMRDRGMNASLSIARSGPKARLDAQTAWQVNHRVYDGPLDGDFSRADIVSIYNDYGDRFNRVGVWTQEVRLSSAASAGGRLQWVTGLFLFAQDNPVRQATVFGKDAGLFGIPDKNFSLVSQNVGRGRGAALFGQGTYRLADRLSGVAGLRIDREWRRLEVRGEYEKGTLRFVTRPDTSATGRYGAVSPRLGLQYAFSGGGLAYAGYSRGFRAGGLTTLGSDPGQPPLVSFDEEYSDNLEAGLKTGLGGGKASSRLAVFYTNVSGAQVPTLLLPDAVTVTRNAGRMRSYGVEAELEARLSKGLSLTARAGLTDARYTRLVMAENGREKDLSGNRQVFTPAHTALLAAEYVAPIGRRARWRLEARVEAVATGRQYFDFANRVSQSDYTLLNSRLGMAGSRWSLHAWGRNLTGRTYLSYAYDFGAVRLGDPATWGLTLTRGG